MRPREPVPDLLKRFVETPFRCAGDYIVESNDSSIVEQLGETGLRIPSGFRLRVIREHGAESDA